MESCHCPTYKLLDSLVSCLAVIKSGTTVRKILIYLPKGYDFFIITTPELYTILQYYKLKTDIKIFINNIVENYIRIIDNLNRNFVAFKRLIYSLFHFVVGWCRNLVRYR